MDKETILNCLANARQQMREGKFIQAYNEIGFILECLKPETNSAPNSPQQNRPTGFDFPSCPRREHSSRVIGTQNNSGEKSIVSPEDTIQSKHKAEMDKDYDNIINTTANLMIATGKFAKEDGGVKQ